MILDTGTKAPKILTKDVRGLSVDLTKIQSSYTLLVFLRYSGCPWCNLAVHRLALEYKTLQKQDCSIIAFIQSDKESIEKNIYQRHKPKPLFPIVADKQMKFYSLYGVTSSVPRTLGSVTKIPYWLKSVRKHGFRQKAFDGDLFVVPAWFLVSKRTGKIVRSAEGVDFYNHETFTPIYESLTFKDE